MKQLVHNKVTTVRVMGKTDYSSVVEFTDESFTPINVSKHLIEAGYAMKESKALITAHETSNIGKEGNGKFKKHKGVCFHWGLISSYVSMFLLLPLSSCVSSLFSSAANLLNTVSYTNWYLPFLCLHGYVPAFFCFPM